MDIQPEKGIPIPPKKTRGLNTYPWKEMEIGDSFFVPCRDGETTLTVQRRLTGTVGAMHVRLNHRYATRQLEGGVRAWRVE